MIILGIETSCDETAAAVVRDGTKLISNVVASSAAMHAKYGGIIPEQAAREQVKSIIPVIHEALTTGRRSVATIDAIAVTVGPGLIGSLLVGVETAKTLAFAWNKPIVPVNHLIGHIYGNWIDNPSPPKFPSLVLLVSGGHTELVLMKGHGQFKLLGATRDDAAGECFDKCGRLLGLPYPYGPFVEKLAREAKLPIANSQSQIKLPRPLVNSKDLDFSFSGLKTAFLYEFKRNQHSLSDEFKSALAWELQSAIVDVLTKKLVLAATKYPVKSLIVVGGVAANKKLCEEMTREANKLTIPLFIPPINLCADNAVYIASAAFFNYKPVPWQQIDADPGLDIKRPS